MAALLTHDWEPDLSLKVNLSLHTHTQQLVHISRHMSIDRHPSLKDVKVAFFHAVAVSRSEATRHKPRLLFISFSRVDRSQKT